MQIVKSGQTNKLVISSSTVILEYLTDDKDISGAVAEIHGRYPEDGFAFNETSKELVYILEGKGEIITENGKHSFLCRDVILVDKGEKYYWQGNFSMFMANTPKFSSDQHKIVK